MAAESFVGKLYQFGRMFYHWRIRGSEVIPYHPTEISLELTNRCNFKCAFCPQSDPKHFDRVPATAVTPEQAGRIFEKLRKGGIRTSVIHWTLDGEPFMNKRFHEVVAMAVSHGFDTHHFATNGFFVTPERLHEFPSKGQRYYLTPDFCSDEEYFETYRGTPGSWRQVLENLRGCLNDPTLSHFHFKMHDITSYKIHDPAEQERRFEALKALFPESERLTIHRRVFHNATGHLPIADEKRTASRTYHLCPYPWFSFMIASNGDVVACCRDLEHKTVLGNLFEQEFEEIWNGDKYRALRRDLVNRQPDKQAACVGCDMPYDTEKFSLGHLAKTAVHRMLIFDQTKQAPRGE